MQAKSIKQHVVLTLKLGLPLILGQITVVAMSFVDTVMAGKLGSIALAAVGVGSAVWASVVVFVLGILMATPPLVSEMDGASRHGKIGPLIRQVMWLAIGLAVVSFIVLRNLPPVFEVMGTRPEVRPEAIAYLKAISWGIFPFTLFLAFRYLADGVSHTRFTMYISFLGLLLNIPLNYILMFGKLGFPALGVRGCGYATAAVLFCQMLAYGGIIAGHRHFRVYRVFGQWEKPDWAEIRRIVKLGFPIGVAVFAEAGFFSVVTIMASRLEPHVIAAHQITLNFASLLFMIPLGLAMAITIRVGNAVGRKSPEDIRRAGWVGIGLTLLTQTISALILFNYPEQIARLYTDDAMIISVAVSLLFLAGIFQLADGLQVAAAGALRGLQDTRFLMFSTILAFWGVGFVVSWWLAFEQGQGAEGLWIGLIAGLILAAILNLWRFYQKTRPESL
jgi:MATE family multidrug resistance protein